MFIRYQDLTEGMKVFVDTTLLDCAKHREATVMKEDGLFYVECDVGKHFLDGQTDPDGILVGVYDEDC